jgi:hypothetical protein
VCSDKQRYFKTSQKCAALAKWPDCRGQDNNLRLCQECVEIINACSSHPSLSLCLHLFEVPICKMIYGCMDLTIWKFVHLYFELLTMTANCRCCKHVYNNTFVSAVSWHDVRTRKKN